MCQALLCKQTIISIHFPQPYHLFLVSNISLFVPFVPTNKNNRTEDAEDLLPKKNKDAEWNPPAWTQGLIVKPDEKQIKGQARLWGILTLIGVAVPPAISYMNRFTWLVCIAQLSFRGMPRESMESGGLGISFGSGPGAKKHLKVAWLLGLGVSLIGAVLVYSLMPTWAKGQRYTSLIIFGMRNLMYGVACSYLQPYKG
mmetsp:Transcript_1346/g.2981  ORF Transcript_1346/g.2981 Transcript_1346/m.2981 type:complete len:199 (+) Transcript_1346:809-1405(+)